MSLWGSEGRWALISRHMYGTGEVFQPLLGSVLYWDKPLLSYWLILPFAFINGGVTEAIVRLPSVISALLLLLLTFDMARLWFGIRTALLSTAVLATSYGFVFWGRNAQVEMLNAVVIFLSIWYFLKHKSDKSPGWLYLFGVIMGLGANLKGLPAYGVPIFSIALLLIVRRERPNALSLRHCFAAMALSLIVYLSLPLTAVLVTGTWSPLELVWQENVVRFFQPFDHKGPIWTYFVRIFDLAAPWSLLLPAALIHLLPKFRDSKSPTAELGILFAAIFVFFTLSGSRRSYYLLPILPFASILTGLLLMDFSERLLTRPFDLFVASFGFIVGIIFAAPLFALVFYPSGLPFVTTSLWIASLLSAFVSTALIGFSAKRRAGGMAASMMAAWLLYSYGMVPLSTEFPNLRTQVMEVKKLGKPCAFYPKAVERVLFYLDSPCLVFTKEESAYEWAVREGGVVIVDDETEMKKWRSVVESHSWKAMLPPLSQNSLEAPEGVSDYIDHEQSAAIELQK